MKIVCVIPARYASTRFPKKMLASLGDKPLLQHVWENASTCPHFDEVIIAVDHEETAELVSSFGARCVMTSPDLPSGTDRLIEVMRQGVVAGDIWVNWQGDEPFLSHDMIGDLLQSVESGGEVWTLKKPFKDEAEKSDPNKVKVVTSRDDKALYFSRSPIPGDHHVGLYAYSRQALEHISKLKPSPLELAERLEQLRFLENGMKIKAHPTTGVTFGIDTPADLLMAEKWLQTYPEIIKN